jgi:hypothetical protein
VNREEALVILKEQIARLRELQYNELLEFLDNAISIEVVGSSGTHYQIEMEAIWDREPKSDLRVVVSIDDGSLLRSTFPLVDDFIVLPDGTFVGE